MTITFIMQKHNISVTRIQFMNNSKMHPILIYKEQF